MDPFEHRLAALCSLLGLGLAAGCTLVPEADDHVATPADCTASSLPDRWVVTTGTIDIEASEACPQARTDLEVHGDTCLLHVWKGVTCDFLQRVEEGVPVSSYDGGWTADDTGAPNSVWCEYSAVFEVRNACQGRPLLGADGHARVAGVRQDTAWSVNRDDTPELMEQESPHLAHHWLRAARMEHASIGSFSRFTLDLLRFGAPPVLLAAAQHAALDEVRHAQLCFDIASRLIGSRVGPARLSLDDVALVSASRTDFAEAVAREGCIGETLAALDAAARLSGATDPDVHAALTVIAEDESRHAALAWQTLRWLLSEDDGTIRERLSGVFAVRPVPEGPPEEISAAERAFGLIDAAEQRRVFAEGWRRVVAPAWEALAV